MTTSLETVLNDFKKKEQAVDITQAKWYIVAAASLAAASGGDGIVPLYRLAIADVDPTTQKLVQRRLKEAILKTSCLYGVPKSLQALLPLFTTLKEDEIDHYGPRTESLSLPGSAEKREARGRQYFDTIYGAAAAQLNRDRNFHFHPDMFLLNLKMIYEWHLSEDAILDPVETQMCNTAALICSNCPVQALWHMKGIVRHGGSVEQAEFAQTLGLSIAKLYECKTGDVTPVGEVDFNDHKL